MSVRVEVVTPCEHGEWNPHRSGDGEIVASSDGAEIMAVICRGASRKAFTEWPLEAIEAAAELLFYNDHGYDHNPGWEATLPMIQDYFRSQSRAALAAAWGHITGKDE